jgi:hypothetical protein
MIAAITHVAVMSVRNEPWRHTLTDVRYGAHYGLNADIARGPRRAKSGHRSLFHQFDLAKPPLLSEERLKRAVEAQQREPTFAGHGLNPVPARDAC